VSKEKKEESYNGGDLLVQCLLNEGVEYIFGIVGGQLLAIYDAVNRWGKDKGIETIMTRHEQAAGHMADGYARVTGKIGVCMGTVGPGVTHLIPAVAAAYMDSIPLLVIGAQILRVEDRKGVYQGDVQQIEMLRPITKFQIRVEVPNEIPGAVRACFIEALSGRQRPVFLEIRESALTGRVSKEIMEQLWSPELYRPQTKLFGDPKQIEKALELLKNAKKPFLIVGGGVMRSGAWEELRKFSIKYKIPIGTTPNGVGSLGKDDETFVGTSVGPTYMQNIAKTADVVMAVGCKWDFTLFFGGAPLWGPNQKTIHVDIDPQVIGLNRKTDIGIVADAKAALTQILEKSNDYLKENQFSEWNVQVQEYKEKREQLELKPKISEKVPIQTQRLLNEIFNFFPKETIFAIDGGDLATFCWMQVNTKHRPPRSTLASISMGHLGVGIPYVIGAKFAFPDKPCVNIVGDGSFLFNVQELDTAIRYKLPIINIIANNYAWGMIKSGQKYGWDKRFYNVDLIGTDYAQIAKGFGCYAETVEKPEDIKPAFQRAIDSGLPAVINVIMEFKTPDATKILQTMKKAVIKKAQKANQ